MDRPTAPLCGIVSRKPLKTAIKALRQAKALSQRALAARRGVTGAQTTREQRRPDPAKALSAIQDDESVARWDALAESLAALGGPYGFHGRLLPNALELTPRQYRALDKLEQPASSDP